MPSKVSQEVGDLFVTETMVTVKLMPSKRTGSRLIRWFSGGNVTNLKLAAKDIAFLIGKVQGKTRLVRALTVMTDRGPAADPDKIGLTAAVQKAGFQVIR
ncbi:MAG: hypothetical protein HY549_11595 [Elusimicrobia bacterium]|nr:hypothetical protein [Elusimicrobiota bacterium]